MRIVYIEFTYTNYEILFDDDLFAKNFCAVFEANDERTERIDNKPYQVIEVIGDEGFTYSVILNSVLIQKSMNCNEATYCITRIISDNICDCVDDNVYCMHAASVAIDGGFISFSGSSGSGKTTLALLFSKYGRFAGDEYAYININTGSMWHERHPYQLKSGNLASLPKLTKDRIIEVEGEPFGLARYVSLLTTNYLQTTSENPLRLRVLVFPHYTSGCKGTTINKMPAKYLPEAVLGSTMGWDLPSSVFSKFIRMAAHNGISFLMMEYCDGVEASRALFNYLQGFQRKDNI